MSLEYLQTRPSAATDTLVIWLHGLGADGHDFEGLVPELKLPADSRLNFIFPHAPYRPITLNNGYVMRGWYDIPSLEFDHDQDELGIRESAELLAQLIEQQVAAGIAPENIILAGFSQGGAMALHTGLRYGRTLGGIIALSCYLPLAQTLQAECQQANAQTPIFMAHGLEDEIVRYQYGVKTRNILEQAGYPVDWHDYSMGHSVCGEEIRHIRGWLLDRAGR
jgi:phospholipase/carboxylesterase